MDNDDRQVGRILSRREILALFGMAGAAVLAGCVPQQAGSTPLANAATEGVVSSPTVAATATPAPGAEAQTSVPLATADSSATVPASTSTATASAATTGTLPTCIVSPEQTEGPYFVDDQLNRADIRSDPSDGSVKEGAPLQLTLRVSQANGNGCQPLAGAIVDIWHCDALGVYSDVTDRSFNTVGKKFLRGYQVTDADGTVQFTTIYPGWYQGRTVHIHFKIRADNAAGQSYEFTSQLYFDDSITDQVYTQAPYASKGQRTVKNAGDGIFGNGGNQLLLTPTVAGQGYAATFDVGLQMA